MRAPRKRNQQNLPIPRLYLSGAVAASLRWTLRCLGATGAPGIITACAIRSIQNLHSLITVNSAQPTSASQFPTSPSEYDGSMAAAEDQLSAKKCFIVRRAALALFQGRAPTLQGKGVKENTLSPDPSQCHLQLRRYFGE